MKDVVGRVAKAIYEADDYLDADLYPWEGLDTASTQRHYRTLAEAAIFTYKYG